MLYDALIFQKCLGLFWDASDSLKLMFFCSKKYKYRLKYFAALIFPQNEKQL